ncbi:RagB/SusD family nutrient uptake outer membrane protein [Flagellimonas sp. HMM57]|uniref:RagB/SusD family nutrient uptake outer membrane protein n=1 Tax=unclassified Flagellimonas TaxID=2644544 RepID=UPI0013D69580|nr:MULTISPECIES: RagB/SusD family nutrient uptake outer membrane protein [unclassified Flagellimonas]UII76476.1 RagB/SusD family nutrient uptake outer membrane protein [Flagellimonas sp. HMM57]
MKNIFRQFLIFVLIVSFSSCKEELDIPLSSLTTDDVVPSTALAEKLVVGTYAGLEMRREAAASNWTFGGCASDDAFKGSEPGDQSDITQMEIYNVAADNPYVRERWRGLYEGIARANAAIGVVNGGLESGAIEETVANAFLGELRFLRGFYHFQLKMTFGNVPYIDETATETPPNDTDIYPNIEADFQFAIDNLDLEAQRYGGANQWNAKAYLAKVHMYQLDYAAAKPLLQDIIDNGPYSLMPSFHQNFNYAFNNNSETVFAVQYAVNDGAGASQDNGNQGDELNYPHSASPFGCCGFYQPTHDLVNAYLTDANGLPLTTPPSNPADYVANVDPSDTVAGSPRNVPTEDGEAGTSVFAEETRNLDPRLDWTVARPGIPLFDRGDFLLAWSRDPAAGGPYYSKKLLWSEADDGLARVAGGWGQNISTIQTNLIRYSEILLWRAEIAASESDLGTALALVDQVRARNVDPDNWVKENDGVTNAANYAIGLYADNGGFADATFAMNAVIMEYRLETAMEGRRFFDLVRRGIAKEVLDGYTSRPQFRSYLDGVTFPETRGIYPVPQEIVDLSAGVIKQNSY